MEECWRFAGQSRPGRQFGAVENRQREKKWPAETRYRRVKPRISCRYSNIPGVILAPPRLETAPQPWRELAGFEDVHSIVEKNSTILPGDSCPLAPGLLGFWTCKNCVRHGLNSEWVGANLRSCD
jgi:hypothetical protein